MAQESSHRGIARGQYQALARQLYEGIGPREISRGVRFCQIGGSAVYGVRTFLGHWDRLTGPGTKTLLTRVRMEQPGTAEEEQAAIERGYRRVLEPVALEGDAPSIVLTDNSLHTGATYRGAVLWAMQNAERLGAERIWTLVLGMDEKNAAHLKVRHPDGVVYAPLSPDGLRERAPEAYERLVAEADAAKAGVTAFPVPVPGEYAVVDSALARQPTLFSILPFLGGQKERPRPPRDRLALYADYRPSANGPRKAPWEAFAERLFHEGAL